MCSSPIFYNLAFFCGFFFFKKILIQTNVASATMNHLRKAIYEETFENAHWRKVKQMQPMLLCIILGKQFEVSCVGNEQTNVTNATLHPLKQVL